VCGDGGGDDDDDVDDDGDGGESPIELSIASNSEPSSLQLVLTVDWSSERHRFLCLRNGENNMSFGILD